MPSVRTQTRVHLIIHAQEVPKPTNSGLLAIRCLENSAYFVRGLNNGIEFDSEQLLDENRHPLLLFPNEGARELSLDLVQEIKKPITLMVPDGNWKQASRMTRRDRVLREIPRVTLPRGPLSEYKLRREPENKEFGLATLEAIIRALAILEGQEKVEPILEIFRIMVARTLWTKGKLPACEVYGGLPKVSTEKILAAHGLNGDSQVTVR